jgi:hypothetical protein
MGRTTALNLPESERVALAVSLIRGASAVVAMTGKPNRRQRSVTTWKIPRPAGRSGAGDWLNIQDWRPAIRTTATGPWSNSNGEGRCWQ